MYKEKLLSGFDPLDVNTSKMDESHVNYRGRVLLPPFQVPEAERVATGNQFDFKELPFRNPKCFQAGNLHTFLDEWRTIEPSDEVLD